MYLRTKHKKWRTRLIETHGVHKLNQMQQKLELQNIKLDHSGLHLRTGSRKVSVSEIKERLPP